MRTLTISFYALSLALLGYSAHADVLLISCKNGNRQHMGIVDTELTGYQELFGHMVKVQLKGGYLVGDVRMRQEDDKKFLISLKSGAFSQNDGEIDPYIICGSKTISEDQPNDNTFREEIRDPHITEWNPRTPSLPLSSNLFD